MARNDGLNMMDNWIYESILCTGIGPKTNLAPIGVRKKGDDLMLDLFMGSRTQKNLELHPDFSINFPPDAGHFYLALQDSASLATKSASEIRALLLADAPLAIEAQVKNALSMGEKQRVFAREVCRHVRGKARLYNRAEPLLLESLIVWTRRKIMPTSQLEEILLENQRIINRVAPQSQYVHQIASLVNACRALRAKRRSSHAGPGKQ